MQKKQNKKKQVFQRIWFWHRSILSKFLLLESQFSHVDTLFCDFAKEMAAFGLDGLAENKIPIWYFFS